MTYNNIFRLLESSIYTENAAILTRGYKWFYENLYFPTITIENLNLHYDDWQRWVLCNTYGMLGDISFLLNGYEVANHWYMKNYSFMIDEDDKDVLHDIAYTYEMIGDIANAQKYYQMYYEYCDDEYKPTITGQLQNSQIIQAYSKLAAFQPDWLIDKYSCISDKNDLYKAVTMAYFTRGEAASVEVFTRMKDYFSNAEKPLIDSVDFFYAADYFVDTPVFWNLILTYKPSVSFTDINLDLCSSECWGFDNSIISDTIQLHIFRTENDIDSMTRLQEKNLSWQSPRICTVFYQNNNRMPSWSELYEQGLNCQSIDK
ncbi:MAG: hypothetical protein LBU65_06450 [Planctomycetaceae bacterium]|jgi:hypothetical protein|nr:hypothetical protein [Planctomycetaceae bacterium]